MSSVDIVDVLGPVQNAEVINKYMDYVKSHYKKKKVTPAQPVDPHTIVEHFCRVASDKTEMPIELTVSSIVKFAEAMNKAATEEDWGTSQREWVINQIATMTGNNKIRHLLKGSAARSFMTPEGQALADITIDNSNKAGTPYYGKNYVDVGNSYKADFSKTSILKDETLLRSALKSAVTSSPVASTDAIDVTIEEQKTHSNQEISLVAKNNKNPQTILIINVERKLCAKCWMCGFNIYVYKFTDSANNVFYASCGQDEHVLPPGWGNIVGILWSNKTDHLNYNINTNLSLHPAHYWCNQGKNAEVFLQIPTSKTSFKFAYNEEGMKRYYDKAKKWLYNKTNAYNGHDMVPQRLYSDDNIKGKGLPEALIEHMKITMEAHMANLIKDLNKESATPLKTNTLYDIFMLRTIVCIVYIYTKLVERAAKPATGGYAQTGGMEVGGTDGYTFNNINLKDDLLASCIYDTNDSPSFKYYFGYFGNKQKTAVRTPLDSCRRFNDIEKELICSFDNYTPPPKESQPEKSSLRIGVETFGKFFTSNTDTQSWDQIRAKLDSEDDSNQKKTIINTLPHAIALLVTSYLSPNPPPVLEEELT
jgi:hypothetical protein